MSYSTALEMKQSAFRWLQSDRGLGWYRQCWKNETDGDAGTVSKGNVDPSRTLRDLTVGGLSDADVYYWHPSLCGAIQDAAMEAPEIVFRAEMLPSLKGFCWFGAPLLDPGAGHPDVTAVSWYASTDSTGVVPGVVVTPWFKLDDTVAGLPAGHVVWDIGSAVARMAGMSTGAEHDAKATWLIKLLGSMLVFMEQRIVVAHPTEADRATRRRLQRENVVADALIQVVQLRRSEHQPSMRHTSHQSVDWSCQWLVRPHWALRWCGEGRTEQRAVYILPHVKGPADKPLRAPSDRVFAVTR